MAYISVFKYLMIWVIYTSIIFYTKKCHTFCPQVHCLYLQWDAFKVHAEWNLIVCCSKPQQFDLCRLYLACLHYNENCKKKQAETKAGEKRYAVMFPKYKGGGHIVRKVFENSTYGMCAWNSLVSSGNCCAHACTGYVDELFTHLWKVVGKWKRINTTPQAPSPPPLCSNYEKPDKQEAIIKHQSRFQ